MFKMSKIPNIIYHYHDVCSQCANMKYLNKYSNIFRNNSIQNPLIVAIGTVKMQTLDQRIWV